MLPTYPNLFYSILCPDTTLPRHSSPIPPLSPSSSCNRNQQYAAAQRWFTRALELVPGGSITPAWEATVVNLAHALRKQQQYPQALALYEQAVGLNPHNPASYIGTCGGIALMMGPNLPVPGCTWLWQTCAVTLCLARLSFVNSTATSTNCHTHSPPTNTAPSTKQKHPSCLSVRRHGLHPPAAGQLCCRC